MRSDSQTLKRASPDIGLNRHTSKTSTHVLLLLLYPQQTEVDICKHIHYTGDIATFFSLTEFKYCLRKYIDYGYNYGKGKYPKMGLESGIIYLTETKD
jgi:hypothetical protein